MTHLPMTKLISSLSKRSIALPVPELSELLVCFIHFDHFVTPKEDKTVALPWHTLCPGRAVPDVCAQHAKAMPKTWPEKPRNRPQKSDIMQWYAMVCNGMQWYAMV